MFKKTCLISVLYIIIEKEKITEKTREADLEWYVQVHKLSKELRGWQKWIFFLEIIKRSVFRM
jgi:hypothetical protein